MPFTDQITQITPNGSIEFWVTILFYYQGYEHHEPKNSKGERDRRTEKWKYSLQYKITRHLKLKTVKIRDVSDTKTDVMYYKKSLWNLLSFRQS